MSASALISQIEQELIQIQEMVTATERMLEKVQRTQDLDYLGTIALNLQSFYTAAERIFLLVARLVDSSVPSGDHWHQQLLAQMSVAIAELRQPVLRETTRLKLDEFRRFRHVVRSRYAHQLDPERVIDLAEKLVDISHSLIQDCQSFSEGLRATAEEEGTTWREPDAKPEF